MPKYHIFTFKMTRKEISKIKLYNILKFRDQNKWNIISWWIKRQKYYDLFHTSKTHCVESILLFNTKIHFLQFLLKSLPYNSGLHLFWWVFIKHRKLQEHIDLIWKLLLFLFVSGRKMSPVSALNKSCWLLSWEVLWDF